MENKKGGEGEIQFRSRLAHCFADVLQAFQACRRHQKMIRTSKNKELFCILSEVFFLFGVARGLQWSTGLGVVSVAVTGFCICFDFSLPTIH